MSTNNNVAFENKRPRVDVLKKVSGAAKYTADIQLPNMIFAKFIRFPYGKGKLVSADVDAAKAVPGVLEVEVDEGADAEYCGAAMGHIVAESRAAISDAMEALNLKFEHTKPVSNPMTEYKGPPDVKPEEQEVLDKLFTGAGAVVEATYTTEVQTHSCLEPHGTVADVKADSAEVWGSTQGTFAFLDGMTRPTGLPASKITVHNEFVGGGFGSKFGPDAEGQLAGRLSRKYKRPCRVMLDRREEHIEAGNRPGSIQYMKIAVTDKGRVRGGRIHVVSTVGHQGGGGGVKNPLLYVFGNVTRTESEILLNAGLPRAFRAPGHPQGVFAVESMMDELAAKMAIDPVEFRKRNEESERRKSQLDIGAKLIGWENRQPDGSQKGRVRRGYGCGGGQWYTWPTQCGADCDVHRDGHVEVRAGVQDIGTGTFTLVTDVAAHEFGIDRTMITGLVGNSKYPEGPGSGGSAVSRSVAPAVVDAVRSAKAKLIEVVAREWKLEPAKVEMKDGEFREIGGSKKLAWAKGCALMSSEKISVRGDLKKENIGKGTADCVQFVEADVDTESGNVMVRKVVAVHACGTVVNRLTTENQICGGVIQGLSFALFEDRRLDPVLGNQLNADFLNYKIAGAVDIPEIIPVLDVRDEDTAVWPLGEPSTIPTAGAIANAVANALGVRVRSLPITPRRVLEALNAKGMVS